jgi:hypothetical protein
MKHFIYILLATVLGVILSFAAHAVIEMRYISYLLDRDIVPTNYGALGHSYCTLTPAIQIGLLVAGIALGFIVGRIWWRIVYVQKRRR